MVYIYAVRLSDGRGRHDHISRVRWKDPDTSEKGQSSRAEMVQWLSNGGAAYVCGDGHLARVGLVRASPPYLRTHADGTWSDNLLALPRF